MHLVTSCYGAPGGPPQPVPLPLELELDLLLELELWQVFPELADLPEFMEPLPCVFLLLCTPEPPETNSISFNVKTLISCSFIFNEEL